MAGNLAKHVDAWKTLTSDERILSIVTGCQLEFVELPCQTAAPKEVILSNREAEIIHAEIDKLLCKGVITKASHSAGEFI